MKDVTDQWGQRFANVELAYLALALGAECCAHVVRARPPIQVFLSSIVHALPIACKLALQECGRSASS